MRRHLLNVLAIVVMFLMVMQSNGQTVRAFKVESLDSNGTVKTSSVDSILVNHEIVDITFFHTHFQKPEFLPPVFVDHKYRKQVIELWANENSAKDYIRNYTHTYAYDSLSRVIRFEFSGCLNCDSQAYKYYVKYNMTGQIESIQNNLFFGDSYKIFYNSTGEIDRVECYSDAEYRRLNKCIKCLR